MREVRDAVARCCLPDRGENIGEDERKRKKRRLRNVSIRCRCDHLPSRGTLAMRAHFDFPGFFLCGFRILPFLLTGQPSG